MICDAFDDKFDTAILISADADLTPIIETIRNRFGNKRIIVAFPPGRNSEELIRVAHGFMRTGRSYIAQSQLPHKVRRDDGFILERPQEWA